MQSLTIIVPCYNEAARICPEDYKAFLSLQPVRIIFVNDGSTDRTLDTLKEMQLAYPQQIQIIDMDRNRGKAEAVRRGILKAAGTVGNEIIGFMDADLSTPLEEVKYFLQEFKNEKLEVVFGSRFSRIGARINRFHHRHYLGRVIATCISIYLKIPIYDSQCGAKFFHADFARLVFQEPFVSRWLFDVEIFKRIGLMGINIEDCALELPLHTWIEQGDSKLGMKDFLKLPLEFYKIIRHYRRTVTKPAPALNLSELAEIECPAS